MRNYLRLLWRFWYWRYRNSSFYLKNLYCKARFQAGRHDSELRKRLTVAVTTYGLRYDQWFKPLLFCLIDNASGVHIIVNVNGFHDLVRHQQYLGQLRRDWYGQTVVF